MKTLSEKKLRTLIRSKLLWEMRTTSILTMNTNSDKITPDEMSRYISLEITKFANDLEELAIENMFPFLSYRLSLAMEDIKEDIRSNNFNPLNRPEHDYYGMMKRAEKI